MPIGVPIACRLTPRMAEIHPQALVDAEAAHGLEQQLIHAVVECLSEGSGGEGTAAARRHQDLMVGFEHLLQAHPNRNVRMAELCAALGVSDRLMRGVCAEHLGMSPTGYHRLRRMSLVRRALRHGNEPAARVSEVARRYGFAIPAALPSNIAFCSASCHLRHCGEPRAGG
jgi:AraC-like DNA-binding protein